MGCRSISVLSAIVAAVAQSAAAATAPAPSTYVNPDWLKKPTAAQTAAVYPQRAMLAGVAGSVTLACKVLVTGDLDDCLVTREVPARMDFGAAALRLAPLMKMTPKLKDNVPIEGTATIPINFSPPNGPSFPADSEEPFLIIPAL